MILKGCDKVHNIIMPLELFLTHRKFSININYKKRVRRSLKEECPMKYIQGFSVPEMYAVNSECTVHSLKQKNCKKPAI